MKYSSPLEVLFMRTMRPFAPFVFRGLFALLISSASLLVFIPAHAHHGAASYDSQHFTTLKGTVTEFRFFNPHTEILFDVKDSAGKVTKWIAEGVSATAMSRGGWSRETLKPGDPITIVGNASKNGSPSMRLSKVTVNGKDFSVERGEDTAEQ
jgi:hypothetical protein